MILTQFVGIALICGTDQVLNIVFSFVIIAVPEYSIWSRTSAPSILLSHNQWLIFNHGAWLCLQYVINKDTEIEINCVNEPEYLSVSYIAIRGNDASSSVLVDKLLTRSWSAWIFTDRGKVHKSRIISTPEPKLHRGTYGVHMLRQTSLYKRSCRC